MEIVLASHSNLAKGMYDSVTLIMGKQQNLHYITAYVDDNVDFKNQLVEEIEPIKDQKIVFVTDIIGGSVNNNVIDLTSQNESYFLISGMNLPLILELITKVSSIKDLDSVNEIEENLQQVVELGSSGIKLIKVDNSFTEEESF
ncbi:PTS sugar transporter subunit IIA [Lactobacillus sp. ESL0681]|uniref:PTS sugar transporter subunit IIA n=1 Tax=Lactobacillus sp. ESL0681 TaxID=2983211 RepID=UPI0023F66D80|nr:PTS sugar transporter subunit IIA [Lactobacillus sp. ESL0681]WEV40380.1 PTS sugar transporter subunit IIA [Lactobacillus sp. ESL0681]